MKRLDYKQCPGRLAALAVAIAGLGLALGATAASAQSARHGRGLRDDGDRTQAHQPVSRVAEPHTRGERVETKFQFPVGSIVVVNNERRLYYITGAGEAVRYRVAVGKAEELWMGRTFVAAKVVDPKWIPVNGDDPVEGGDPANPLGKRALYLDWSLLRIHGTPSRGSIGAAVSHGCIRMLNEDVLDLFDRVHYGAPVYAIRSWKDATLYEDRNVTEKLYVDPAAHEEAKKELEEQLKERAGDLRDRDAQLRRDRKHVAAATSDRSKFKGRVALDRSSRRDSSDD